MPSRHLYVNFAHAGIQTSDNVPMQALSIGLAATTLLAMQPESTEHTSVKSFHPRFAARLPGWDGCGPADC